MLRVIVSFFILFFFSYDLHSATAYKYQYTDDVYQKAKRVAAAIRYFLNFSFSNRQYNIPIRVFTQFGYDYLIYSYNYDNLSSFIIDANYTDGQFTWYIKMYAYLVQVYSAGSPYPFGSPRGLESVPSLPSYLQYKYGCWLSNSNYSSFCYTYSVGYPVGSSLNYWKKVNNYWGSVEELQWRRFLLVVREADFSNYFDNISNNMILVRSTDVIFNDNYYYDYLFSLSTNNYQNSNYDNFLRSRQEYQDWLDYFDKGYIDARNKVVGSSSPVEFVTEYPSEYNLSVSTDYLSYYFPRFLDSLNRIENKISSSVVVNTTANVNVNIDISTTNTLLNNIYNFLSSTSDVDYSVLSDTISVATSAISSIFDSFKAVFIQTSSDSWDCTIRFSSFSFAGLADINFDAINLCERWGWAFEILRNLLRLSAIVMSFWIIWEGMT